MVLNFCRTVYLDIILSTSSSFSDFNEMYLLFFDVRLQVPIHTYSSLVKIAFDLKKIATDFYFSLSFRERPKIKYIKSLPKSTHGKDVIFYHKKSRISADFNVTDGMPYTDYLSRGE